MHKLFELMSDNMLLYYLPPSAIVRLLFALRVSVKSMNVSKYLMSPEREMFGNYRELQHLNNEGYTIDYIGNDLELLKEYVWNPDLQLDEKLTIWIPIISQSKDPKKMQHTVLPRRRDTRLKNLSLPMHYRTCTRNPCKCLEAMKTYSHSMLFRMSNDWLSYESPIDSIVDTRYMFQGVYIDGDPKTDYLLDYGCDIIPTKSGSIQDDTGAYSTLRIDRIRYGNHGWKIDSIVNSGIKADDEYYTSRADSLCLYLVGRRASRINYIRGNTSTIVEKLTVVCCIE